MLELLHHETDSVTEILRLQGCLREAVRANFGQAEVHPRRTISELLLEWVFGSRAPKIKHVACCDGCDAGWIRRHGPLGYVVSNVGPVKYLGRPGVHAAAFRRFFASIARTNLSHFAIPARFSAM